MMKFGNLNFKEGLLKRIGALALAGTMTVTMCGCGSKKEEKQLPNVSDHTIYCVMNSIKDCTQMDEFLAVAKNEEGNTFEDLLNKFYEARLVGDEEACNQAVYQIGKFLIFARTAELVGVSYENIHYLDLDLDNNEVIITYKKINNKGESIQEFVRKEYKIGDWTVDPMKEIVEYTKAGYNGWLTFMPKKSGDIYTFDHVHGEFNEFLLTRGSINEEKGTIYTETSEYVIDEYINYHGELAYNYSDCYTSIAEMSQGVELHPNSKVLKK